MKILDLKVFGKILYVLSYNKTKTNVEMVQEGKMVKNVEFESHLIGFSDHPSKLMAQILPENTQES